MPWTIDDVDEHKKGLDAGQKKLWVKVANRHRQDCIDKGGDDGSCDGGAIRAANAMVDRAKENEEITGLAASAIETALAVVNDSGEIDRETANRFLKKLQGDLEEASKPKQYADWSAKKGGRIAGNLYRGAGGKFSGASGGGDEGGGGGTAEPAADLGIESGLTDALAQIASGEGKIDQEALAKLQSLGLATETGGLNTYGRAVLKATKNKDADEIERVMGLAGAQQAAKADRAAKREKAAAKRKKQAQKAKEPEKEEAPAEEPEGEPGDLMSAVTDGGGISNADVQNLLDFASGKPQVDELIKKLAATGLVVPTDDGSYQLNRLGDAFVAAVKKKDAKGAIAALKKAKPAKETEVVEVGRRLNQQRVTQLQGIIDSLQAKLKDFESELGDLEDMIQWASYADQEQEEEPERKTLPWATPAAEVDMAEKTMKTVGGEKFPASDFLVVESPENPSTWHLQVKRNGTPDHDLMGGAKAALTAPGGHRGNKYEGPNKQKAISDLKALYKAEEMPWLEASKEVESMEKEQVQALVDSLAEDGLDLDAARQHAQALLDSLSAPEAEPEAEDAESKEPEAAPVEAQEAETAEVETVEADLSESGGEAGILGLAAEAQPAEGVNPDRAPLGVYVNVIKPGWGNQKDNRYYPPEMLKRDAGVFEGAKMYTSDHKGSEKSERTEVSVIERCPVYFAEDGSPVALARIFDPDFAEKTRNRARAGQLQTLRCSIYAKGSVKPGFEKDGRKGDLVEAIKAEPRPDVDWVTRDGAGGHAVAMAESEPEPEPLAKEAVDAALAETNLPQVAKDWVAEGNYADEAQLQEAVQKAVERVKKLTGAGQPFGQGGSKPASEQAMTDDEYDERFQKIQERYHLSR